MPDNQKPAMVLHEASLTYRTPDEGSLLDEARSARQTADFLIITDQQSLDIATAEMNRMSARVKELEKIRKSITAPMDLAKKNVMALFNPATTLYKDAITIIKGGIARYTLEQERKAAEERAAAEARAAAERQALEQQAEESDSPEQAEAMRAAAAMVVADATAAVTKAKGMSTSKKWRGCVVDLAAFLGYVSTHPELQGCIDVKQGALDRYIAATGGVVQIPGVEVKQEVIVSSRGA